MWLSWHPDQQTLPSLDGLTSLRDLTMAGLTMVVRWSCEILPCRSGEFEREICPHPAATADVQMKGCFTVSDADLRQLAELNEVVVSPSATFSSRPYNRLSNRYFGVSIWCLNTLWKKFSFEEDWDWNSLAAVCRVLFSSNQLESGRIHREGTVGFRGKHLNHLVCRCFTRGFTLESWYIYTPSCFS